MANYQKHWPNILREEGSKTVANDYGAGRSKYGITEKYYPEMWENGEPTLEEAKQFYENNHWHAINGTGLHSEDIAGAVLDFGINAGLKTSIMAAQRIVNDIYGKKVLSVDGKLGTKTTAALNSVDVGKFLHLFYLYRENYYTNLQKNNPEKYPMAVLWQWLGRAKRYSIVEPVSNLKSNFGLLILIATVFFFG